MSETNDTIFVDIPTRPAWSILLFLGLILTGTTTGIFLMMRNYFKEESLLNISIMLVVAFLIALIVTLTLAQLVISANASRRRAVFLSGTDIGMRKGSDGFLLDMSEPHTTTLKIVGDTLTISIKASGFSLRFLIDGFDAPELLERFEEAKLISSEPSCCKEKSITARLEWGNSDVENFVRKLLDLIWEYRGAKSSS